MREFEVEFALECHQVQERFSAYRRAKALQTPFTSLQLAKQEGSVAATGSLLSHSVLSIPQICPTAFKVSENEEGYVLRYYNMCSENVRVPESQHLKARNKDTTPRARTETKIQSERNTGK